MLKVLIIGPSVERTKGGMATVIHDQLQSGNSEISFTHLVSHVEGSAGEKIGLTVKSFVSFLSRNDSDIIHIHVASGASFYRKSLFVLAARLLRRPVVMHVHGADFDSFYLNANPSMQRLIRGSFSSCKAVLVLSAYWKEFFQKHFTNTRVEVLHNGVHAEKFAHCFTAPQHQKQFLFLGRLGERKGVYDLLEVIGRMVKGDDRGDLLFYLAGDGEVAEVKDLVARKGLQNQVIVTGWIDGAGKLDLFTKVDTMVLPSYNEGLPMAILEAMAAGKAIVSTTVGGIPDLVAQGINGYLMAPGDKEALYQYLTGISNDAATLETIAKANQQKIREQYDLKVLNEQLHGLYREIVSKKGG